jgi:hypothetical protein
MTLLELLVAIALVLALVGAMLGFLMDTLSSRGRALSIAARQRAATILIDRVEADAVASMVGDRALGAGLRGDETSIHFLTRRVDAASAPRGTGDRAAFGDLQLAEYRFNPAERDVLARRGEAGASSSAAFHPVGGQFGKVRFRYHDGRQWQAQFDSLGSNRLPSAIEVAIWFAAPARVSSQSADSEATAEFDEDVESPEEDDVDRRDPESETVAEPAPDRIRVIVIPDADRAQRRASDAEAERP